jgi:hypothetical protein
VKVCLKSPSGYTEVCCKVEGRSKQIQYRHIKSLICQDSSQRCWYLLVVVDVSASPCGRKVEFEVRLDSGSEVLLVQKPRWR